MGLSVIAHADDVYLWLKDQEDLTEARHCLKAYGAASGAKINETKSKLYFLDGVSTNITVKLLSLERKDREESESERGMQVQAIKILGILFSLTESGWRENWT